MSGGGQGGQLIPCLGDLLYSYSHFYLQVITIKNFQSLGTAPNAAVLGKLYVPLPCGSSRKISYLLYIYYEVMDENGKTLKDGEAVKERCIYI